MLIELKESDSFHDILAAHEIVLVDFYAGWCEPCKWLDVILSEIDNQLPPNTLILKVDSEKFQELADSYGVRSVPVLALFKSGSVVWRMNGFLMGPDLVSRIQSHV
jgi:thioredoxin 1